jgi:hypothetical protein
MLLLDVEKAFDSIWHDALLLKLIQGDCNILKMGPMGYTKPRSEYIFGKPSLTASEVKYELKFWVSLSTCRRSLIRNKDFECQSQT